MATDRLWRWHPSLSIPGSEELLPCRCSLTSVQATSLGSCYPGNSVGARKSGQEHLPLLEMKSCCQLVCCGSPLSMSKAWKPACSATVQGSGVLGTCVACETPGLHIPKGMLQPKSWTASPPWAPGTHKWGAVLYEALSVISRGKQTTPKVNSAHLRFKSPNCRRLHWQCEMMRLQP